MICLPRRSVAAAVILLLAGMALQCSSVEFKEITESPAAAYQKQNEPPDPDFNPEGMIVIPAGEFIRGCLEEDGPNDELPARKIRLRAFYIDRTEVTVAQYKQCVDDGVCPAELLTLVKYLSESSENNPYCNWNVAGRENHPINCVSWEEAARYCRYRHKRLPTEAEWEKAARGVDRRIYPWGDEPPWQNGGRRGNFCDESAKKAFPQIEMIRQGYDDGYPTTAPVGLFPQGASPYGVLDLAGNVWEWVEDGYLERAYSFAVDENPLFGSPNGVRVYRGGAFDSYLSWLRITKRGGLHQTDRAYWVGFRCAANANEP